MTNELSILGKATRGDVQCEPYPHLVLRNALDEQLYSELEDSFPGYDFFVPSDTRVADRKYLKTGLDSLNADKGVASIWKDFIAYHTSSDFYKEVAALFGPEINDLYPRLETVLEKPLSTFSTGLRNKGMKPDMKNEFDMMLDCQPYIDCTFTERPMRGPHVDAPEELYAALLYMRNKDDDSTGGGLDIRQPSDLQSSYPADHTIRYPQPQGFGLEQSKLVARIPYERNTVVMFINSWRSLHAVEKRSPHILPRRAINIIGEVARFDQTGLFVVESPSVRQKTKGGSVRALVSRVRQKFC